MSAMTMLRELPGVTRAWPDKGHRLLFEWIDGGGRLRAGCIDAQGAVQLAEPSRDPELPTLAPSPDARLLVHRLGRRAVTAEGQRITKHLPVGKPAGVADALRNAARACERAGIAHPQLLEESGCRLSMTVVPGQPLAQWRLPGIDGWQQLVECWPRVCAYDPGGLRAHSPEAEAQTLRRWFLRAKEFGVRTDLDRLEPGIEAACRAVTESCSPLVVAHRDLHPGQMLWDGQRLGVVDWDTMCLAPAALDVANLWAHVELSRTQRQWEEDLTELVLGLLDELCARLGIGPVEFGIYVRATRWRLAMVHAFRPAARPWLDDWLSLCSAPMHSTMSLSERNRS